MQPEVMLYSIGFDKQGVVDRRISNLTASGTVIDDSPNTTGWIACNLQNIHYVSRFLDMSAAESDHKCKKQIETQ